MVLEQLKAGQNEEEIRMKSNGGLQEGEGQEVAKSLNDEDLEHCKVVEEQEALTFLFLFSFLFFFGASSLSGKFWGSAVKY